MKLKEILVSLITINYLKLKTGNSSKNMTNTIKMWKQCNIFNISHYRLLKRIEEGVNVDENENDN